MRIIFLFLLILGFDLVAFQPFQLAISDFPQSIILGITLGYWLVPVALILWLLTNRSDLRQANSAGNTMVIRSIFYLIYFAKFLLILFSLLFQVGGLLASGLTYLIPSLSFSGDYTPFLARISVLMSGVPLLLMINGVLRNRHRYKIHDVEVPISGLAKNLDGLKIIQISDVHSGSFTDKEPIKKGIEMINATNADLAFFTGDLVNSVAPEIEPYTDVFNKIKAKYGVFSILGNHDYGDYVRWPNIEMKKANLNHLISIQKNMGWDLLMNENRMLKINGEKVAIIGVENYSGSPRFSKYGDIEKAYAGSESATLKLLLSHDPSHWDAQIVDNFADIALTFSGHTHGAQFGIEIKGLFKWSPVQYVYKQWAGLYQKGTQYLYVNRGFGYLGYPGRVGILPEITLMRLKSV